MKKAFRIFAALTLLTVYLATTVNASAVSLLCRCTHHHAAAGHVHCVHCHDSAHADCKCPVDGYAFADGCACNHDHSTSVDTYVGPRTSDDDDSERGTSDPVADALLPSDGEPTQQLSQHGTAYGYLPPHADGTAARGISLRAPPASM